MTSPYLANGRSVDQAVRGPLDHTFDEANSFLKNIHVIFSRHIPRHYP